MWLRNDFTKAPAYGFSLIELLVVLVIILVLTLIEVRQFTGTDAHREQADCQKNLQKIYLALSIYQNDNNGAYPFLKDATSPAAPLSLLVPKSTTGTEIFICPGSKDKALPEGESFAGRRISYAYYMGRATNDGGDAALVTDAQIDASSKEKGQALFSATGERPGNNHGKQGGNLLWCGGEISTSSHAASRDLRFPPSVHMLNPE